MNRPIHVVVGVTGSIAAYKAAEIVRRIRERGWETSVVMTRAATRFVGEQTFRTLSRRPVALDMFEPSGSWMPEHISLAERADALLIAPCTANMLARLAHGLADDLLSCVALAARCPIVVAPAMNQRMWEHPATRLNLRTLRERGVRFVEVGAGDLACGREGPGRMAETDAVMAALAAAVAAGEGEEP